MMKVYTHDGKQVTISSGTHLGGIEDIMCSHCSTSATHIFTYNVIFHNSIPMCSTCVQKYGQHGSLILTMDEYLIYRVMNG